MKNLIFLSAILAVNWFPGCDPDGEFPNPGAGLPDEIEVVSPGLYPEGIAYNPWEKVFYLSSLKTGNILEVEMDGEADFLTEDAGFVSTAGLKYDRWRKKVVACNTDIGLSDLSSPATIGILGEVKSVGTGHYDQIGTVDVASLFEGPHAVNDLTLDPRGNRYITDSFSPVIYKVTPKGEGEVLISDEQFTPAPGNFGLNGIVYHPRRFLIVAKYDDKKLFRVPVSNPSDFQEIQLSGLETSNLDGLLLTSQSTLLAVGNNLGPATAPNGVYKIVSHDNWKTATVVDVMDTGDNFPTTLTSAGRQPYVLFAEIDELIFGTPSDDTTYKIKKVSFDNNLNL